jgi:hypothetical protein
MVMKKIVFLFACIFAGSANATIIDFENFASSGSLENVSPTTPYFEDGYTLTPSNSNSAIFDSAYSSSTMLGNTSDWFGFDETNTPTLTLTTSSGPFNLLSVLIGPSTISSNSTIDFLITGNLIGGGILTSSFVNLSTATTATLGWSNLNSVSFSASDDAGIDNINVATSVPEPVSLALLCLGLTGIGFSRKMKSA